MKIAGYEFEWKPFAKLSKNVGNYLKAGTTYSSARLMCVMTIFACNLSLLIIVGTAAVSVLSGKAFDWLGASALVGAIGTIIGVALWGKNAAKNADTASTIAAGSPGAPTA